MITPDYVREMALYNRWQNSQLIEFFAALSDEELRRDRGAFFGSILGTASHLLFGDGLWLSRFDGGEAPDGGIADSMTLVATGAEWKEARLTLDDRIDRWADTVTEADLQGDLIWFARVLGREVTTPKAQSVIHFFNHQTHHRGQIHHMLTQAGSKAPTSDLIFRTGI